MELSVYLSGEIHSDWRSIIEATSEKYDLSVAFTNPVTDHYASDNVGDKILGNEQESFWKDHKAARINSVRIYKYIQDADLVVVRFGDKYKQWNAAFEAGYAVAIGVPVITLHDEEFNHALKEIDAAAHATARTPEQVVEILKYLLTQK
ncbi:MAG: hypothetical protein CL398_09020 [Acidiferrobacteraceae bacterium]|nr:hypothetical protein [Acidiferrobacteraceae bacterium]